MKKNLLGIFLVLVSVLFIGNVYAEEATFKFGGITDVTAEKGDKSSETATITAKVTPETGDNSNLTITYSAASLNIIDADKGKNEGVIQEERPADAAWFGIRIAKPENSDATYTPTLFYKGNQVSFDGEDEEGYYVWVGATVENLKNAIANKTNLTYEFSINWATAGTSTIHTQKVTVVIDPNKTELVDTVTDSETKGQSVWNSTTADLYTKQVEAEKLAAEQNANKTEEKDDEPKTSDTFPMALVGMITLGLAGTYTYRKLHN